MSATHQFSPGDEVFFHFDEERHGYHVSLHHDSDGEPFDLILVGHKRVLESAVYGWMQLQGLSGSLVQFGSEGPLKLTVIDVTSKQGAA